MSLRTVTIDFTAESPISKKEIGLIGEHNATTLNIIPPIDMSTNANISTYTIAFQTGNGAVLHSKTFTQGEEISVDLWQQLTLSATLGVQLEGNDNDGNLIAKSRFVRGLVFMPSPCGKEGEVDTGNDSLVSEIAENTKARHTHNNKSVLDKLAVGADGKLVFDGSAVSSVGGIYAVKTAIKYPREFWKMRTAGMVTSVEVSAEAVQFISQNLTANKDYLWIYDTTSDTNETVWYLGVYRSSSTTDNEVAAVCVSVSIGSGGGTNNVYVGTTQPTDDSVQVWINPNVEVGAGYPLIKTANIKCQPTPAEGTVGYYSTYSSIIAVILDESKYIPPDAKIIGIDFVIDGQHYYNEEIKTIYPDTTTATKDTTATMANFSFYPRHNMWTVLGGQAIAQMATNGSVFGGFIENAGGVTEFTVYYFEAVGNMAVVKVKDSSGNWVYTTTASGEKGDTPIRGVDYWTASDKTEIVNSVLQSLPKWTGGDF